jgi:DHA2 family multidrug resistance protein
VITSFAVANGVSVPLTGWLMQRFGVVRTFVASVVLFTIASLLCGLAWSLPSLIAFRVLQGAVSGPMIPGSQALLINVFGPHKRTSALTIWSITTLGGADRRTPARRLHFRQLCVALDLFDQRAGGHPLRLHLLDQSQESQETPTRKIPIDRIGLALLFVWVVRCRSCSTRARISIGSFTAIVVLLIVTVVSFAAWLIWELTEKHPIVDLSLFKSRSFTLGTRGAVPGYAVFFGNIVLMPLWLQSYVGYTATWAGLVSAPSGVTAILTSLRWSVDAPLRSAALAASFLRLYSRPRTSCAPAHGRCQLLAFMAPQLVQGSRWACSSSPCSR